MKKLPKEKRNHVFLVLLIMAGLVSTWVFVVLQSQLDARHRAGQDLATHIERFKGMSNQLQLAGEFQRQTELAARKLDAREIHMASGDVFSWAVATIKDFKQNRNVDLPQISQPSITKNTLLPGFPYDQVKLTVAGTAFFHDLGVFISDFENEFPYARITNVDIQPASKGDEKLNFRMDLIFLVKPEQSSSRS
jgi:hypothetical protein